MIKLLNNSSKACYHIKKIINENDIKYNDIDRHPIANNLVVKITDGLVREDFTSLKNTLCISYFPDFLVIFYMSNNFNSIDFTINRMRIQNDYNIISVMYESKIDFEINENNDECILKLLRNLNNFDIKIFIDKLQVYNWDANEIIQYKIVDTKKEDKDKHKFNVNHNEKLAKRTYSLDYYNEIYKQLNSKSGGIFFHKYMDYRSKHIPAFGTELRISDTYTETGYGRAYNKYNANIISAIEAIERYVGMTNHSTNKKAFGSYKELNHMAINPKDLILHSEKEYSNEKYLLKRYSENLKYNWIEGVSLKDGKKIFIPEQAVFFGELNKRVNDNCFLYETSNGAAVGGSIKEAILYGLYEIIERDNFLANWYCKFECNEIDIHSTSLENIKNLDYILQTKDIELKLYDISTELEIPSFWAIMKSNNENKYPMAAYNAAGCNLDPEKAAETALFEVITSYTIYNYLLKTDKKIIDRTNYVTKDPNRVTEFQDHVLYYSSYRNAKYLDFASNNEKQIPISRLFSKHYNIKYLDINEELDILLKKIFKIYENAYYVDTTPDNIKKYGLYSVKVIVPGMLPITFGQQYKRVNRKRLYQEYARRKTNTDFSISEEPHPFP